MAFADAHKLLDDFLAENPPTQFIDAPTTFFSSPLPTLHNTTWTPPADEAATRQDLARQLRQNIIAAIPGLGDEFAFTAAQVSTLLLMPLDSLRSFVEKTGHDSSRLVRLINAQAFLNSIGTIRDLVRYFLQGQHPDAASKKRKTPGQEPQPVEQPRDANLVKGKDYVYRSEQQKNKCLARDQHKCIFTHSMHPEACHIIPFAFNSTKTNLKEYTSRFATSLATIFFPPEEDNTGMDLIAAGLGCSDKHWNMLSVNPYLHAWWAKPYWAVQCLGIDSSDKGHAVVLVFHWMPHQRGDPYQKISLEPGASDYQNLLDALADGGSYGEGRGPGMQGFANGIQHDCFRPIVSGQEFRVVLDTLEDAEKMRRMVDIQWACMRIAAMSGAAGPDDLSDDFSEFDFERQAYETAVMLGDLDENRDD